MVLDEISTMRYYRYYLILFNLDAINCYVSKKASKSHKVDLDLSLDFYNHKHGNAI